MKAKKIKIDNKIYRLISEEDYLALLNDIKDLKKVFKRRSEKGVNARDFLKKRKKLAVTIASESKLVQNKSVN